jgi:hypothetical protein
MKQQHLRTLLLAAGVSLCLASVAQGESYDLRDVKGIEAFGGSVVARGLLDKNGFVVADPAFKQIFEAYIKSPQIEAPSETNHFGESLPSFITTDSAWHTYHVLLEEGVKELEQIQSKRLLDFSRGLLAAVKSHKDSGELVWFVSVGLALQDAAHRQSLASEEKRVVEELRSGSQPVVMPVGFPLSPLQFRAQSFYTHSPELSDYFAARQWYASAVFRLSDPLETKMAVVLARLIEDRPELLLLWKQLSEPFDIFLAPAEDGSIPEYVETAKSVSGTNNVDHSITDGQIAEIQKRLESRLPLPQVSDQLLSPQQYAEFSKQTRGFRLLPPRRLPCAVCFHNTVDPRIPGRMYPSGLDFLAASPVLRSPAAVRAVESQFGKQVSELILKTECGPMPDSLHGDAMRLLARLQEPLPASVPAALRTEAWSDLQLWTQLGAWAEQRHTWALHTKLSVTSLGIVVPPKGMVAPYPGFFSGLATLTRRTADAFEKAGLEQRFEAKAVASELLALLTLSQNVRTAEGFKELEKRSGEMEQHGQFRNRYYEKHRTQLEKDGSRDAYKKLEKELEDLARRCATSGQANSAETETLRLFYDCRQNIARLLKDFTPVCDRLAELAKKSLTGQALTEEDAKWIEDYGVTLAGFHFYYGNSYVVPRDDFPIVTRVFSNPLTDSMLYAGLARPQALYVIVKDGKSQQLYRGAVMTYREFVRPNEQLLDDETWREMIAKGQTPPAPPFTRSFLAGKSVADWMKSLRELKFDADYDEAGNILWHLGSQATEKQLPELIRMMLEIPEGTNAHRMERWIEQVQEGTWVTNDFESSADWISEVREGIADIIAGLPWESCQADLIPLLVSTNAALADAAAHILVEQPARLNAEPLITKFDSQPTRTRRLYCAILSRLPQQTDVTRKLLLQALRDREDGVRWQAAVAIATAKWSDEQSNTALLECLNDTNEFVAAAAAHSLAKLGATKAGPALHAKLKAPQSTNAPGGEFERQAATITKDIRSDFNRGPGYDLLDPDHLEMRIGMRVPERAKEMAKRRFPPQPFALPMRDYTLVDALIEALGDLGYVAAADDLFKLRGNDHNSVATRALSKLSPKRLTDELLAIATDKQVNSFLRERALVTLCNIPATNRVRDLVPLLDDTTPIEYERPIPGPEWRICDRTAVSIGVLLGWESPMMPVFVRPELREEFMKQAREWASKEP